MKVLDLRCGHGHGFEGWYASEDEFLQQQADQAIECPMCGDRAIARLPSAPRLNLSGARNAPQDHPGAATGEQAAASPDRAETADGAASPPSPDMAGMTPQRVQAAWLAAARALIERTEDVGPRFPEEARRIHYGETAERPIRGQASPEEREALRDEGIEIVSVPLPPGLKGPVQ
jgi:hypothetical protein